VARILIVEDDEKAAGVIAHHLGGSGHTCSIEKTGENVLDRARRGSVDLLVLDVMLPGISGFELCRRFRADSVLYTTPILILSAMANDEEVMHGLAQGADDYITKPFDVNNLVHRVEGLLHAHAQAAAFDGMTALPSAKVIKREVQKRVSRQEPLTLVSAEMMHLREFAYLCGTDARERAIRHLARALNLCGQGLVAEDFLVGHMGGGYFVCLLSYENAEAFCKRVQEVWDSHLPKLYESAGKKKAYEDTIAGADSKKSIPILELLMCMTTREAKDFTSAQQMFEVVTQIRNSALARKAPGIHIDRRT